MAKRLSLFTFIRNQASRFLANQSNYNTEGERKIHQILQENFPKANIIQVADISGGCGAMYDITIESTEFQNKSRVQQHRMVNEALKEEIKNMHGLRIASSTPKTALFWLALEIDETDSESEEKIAERQRWNRELEERRKLEESRKLAAERDLRTRAWVQEVSRTFYANYSELQQQNQEEDNNHRVSGKRPNTVSDSNVTKKPKANSGGVWKGSLKGYLNSHDSCEFADEKVVIIKDKYPKARHHYLVLPKENIPNLKSLRKENIDILRYMLKKGQEIAGKYHPESRFRLGFHAVPSMSHLHLHVISQDMDSICLKTKKHWNSFVTEYFVDADVVIQQLEKNGSYNVIPAEQGKALLNTPLRCHQCGQPLPTMPKLKQHILTHFPK